MKFIRPRRPDWLRISSSTSAMVTHDMFGYPNFYQEATMAKSQKRSGREPKKPKTQKKKEHIPHYLMGEQQAIPKIIPEAGTAKR